MTMMICNEFRVGSLSESRIVDPKFGCVAVHEIQLNCIRKEDDYAYPSGSR